MIKDYKGEMPKNVTTPEKAKTKKPFYKDWKFWVLTGLMTLFGACSIYGLVLGSQYVKAIERASHIIADANNDSSLLNSKNRYQRPTADYPASGNSFTFSVTGNVQSQPYYICLNDGERYGTMASLPDNCAYLYYYTNAMVGYKKNGSSTTINRSTWKMHFIDVVSYNLAIAGWLNSTSGDSQHFDVAGDFSFSGRFVYDLPSYYYEQGYDDGHSYGYEDGYQEGFEDGADSQANEQTIKVLLSPDFTGDRIQYTYTLDGAEVGTGYLSNTNQHYQNQVQFSRPAGGQHKAVLNLYSDNDEPIKIAYDTFTGTLGETRYLWYMKSNAYDWSTSQWYVPTYWAEARFLVTGYGTYEQGFTEDYFFNLDPQYNDRAKVGAYSEGYDAGYNDAVESGDAYDAGYEQGYDDGERQGETDGFNRGVAVGSSGSQSLAMMFKTAFQLPFDQLYRFLNFNLLGINFLSLFTALISVSIGIMVIKKVL